MSFYKNIFKQAWQISWGHKHLWVLGLFATLIGGGLEVKVIDYSFNSGKDIASIWLFLNGAWFEGSFWHNAAFNISNSPASFAILLLIILAGLAFVSGLVWIAITAQAGLVNNIAKLTLLKKLPAANWKQDLNVAFKAGSKKFWSVLTLNILVQVTIFITFVLISLPIVATIFKPVLIANILYVIAFITLLPLAMAITLMFKYAIVFLVAENKTLKESLIQARHLLISNWLISFEMAVSLFFIAFVYTIVLLLGLLILAIPFTFLAILIGALVNFTALVVVAILGVLIGLIIVTMGGCFLTTYQITAWTNLTLQLASKGGESKIVRMFEALKK